MSLFPKQNPREIFLCAFQARRDVFNDDEAVCERSFLEHYLKKRFPHYEFAVEDELKNLSKVKVDGITTFTPHQRITIDSVVYAAAKKGNGSSRFSMIHEGAHLILHHNDPRTKGITQLNRGIPNSGTSFKEHPELELEANFWSGSYLIPHTAISRETTAKELAKTYVTSIATAERALKIARALFPDKWRLA